MCPVQQWVRKKYTSFVCILWWTKGSAFFLPFFVLIILHIHTQTDSSTVWMPHTKTVFVIKRDQKLIKCTNAPISQCGRAIDTRNEEEEGKVEKKLNELYTNSSVHSYIVAICYLILIITVWLLWVFAIKSPDQTNHK